MPLDKPALITKLKGAGIEFDVIDHPAVMTADDQVQALADIPGTVVKNLFLKDKKGRLYIVSFLPATKVDLKVLSVRMGLGKDGVKMAPAELFDEVLKVPLGSVTPLAVANPEAAAVTLFLDVGIQKQDRLFVHPLVNTSSLAMLPAALDAALKALGREPIYVDLEANPKVDKENPPDLAKYLPEPAAKEAAPAAGAAAGAAAAAAAAPASQPAAAKKPAPADAKGTKSGVAKGGKGDKGSAAQAAQRLMDVTARTETILEKVTQALQSLKSAEGAAATGGESYVMARLKADVEMQLNAVRNAAYTAGYVAGKGELVGFAEKRYS